MRNFIFLFIIGFICNIEFATAKTSADYEITSDLIQLCKNAGGVAKVFPDSCRVRTCHQISLSKKLGKSERCLPSTIASCDCGPQKCLENNKCIDLPKD